MSNDNVNLPSDEIEEGQTAHNPDSAEADSVQSVAKTDDAVKKAPKRKGDKDVKDEPSGAPKTKAGMINAMFSKMNGMKTSELSKMHASYHEDADSEGDELEETSYDFTDDLNALVESEATLSDEFKQKTAVIFEAAINSKISEKVEELEDEYQSRLEEELETTRSDMVEKVDSYLNYVVEQWMEENKVAIESGLRTEIAEGFMDSLKDLFIESYIDVPETKVDLVDELAESVEDLEQRLNEQTGSVLELSEKLEEYQREAVIRESSRDLADTQVEKLRSLVSSLDFESEEVFSEKVKTVRESYFTKESNKEVSEIVEDFEDANVQEISSSMDAYIQAIKKSKF